MLDENNNIMQNKNNTYPIIFLGISQYVKNYGLLPPYTPIDIYGLSRQSAHIFYPIPIGSFKWLFLINTHFILENSDKPIVIEIRSKAGKNVVNFQMKIAPTESTVEQKEKEAKLTSEHSFAGQIAIPQESTWYIQPFTIDATLELPGRYDVYVGIEKATELVSTIDFLYQKPPPFTAEQMKAIESDPHTAKTAIIELGCKYCPTKLKVYTSFNRDAKKETQGYIWQYDLPDIFTCSCKKTNQDLKYIKGGLHGLLGKYKYLFEGNLKFERRHSHEEILRTLKKFTDLLDKKDHEKFFQEFIENNPEMLAKYHAKKIFFKKGILGKFEADIVILNTDNQLIFIELERAGLKLFKKDGQPASNLMHAYKQVLDWINEFKKHPHALLELFNLTYEDITLVKGVVIAGKNNGTNQKHLRRHYANPIYGMEFLTYDCLADSLAQISRDLL